MKKFKVRESRIGIGGVYEAINEKEALKAHLKATGFKWYPLFDREWDEKSKIESDGKTIIYSGYLIKEMKNVKSGR